MILKGNQRGYGTELALHLMKDENEHIEIADMRGFIGDNLMDAFQEIQAISRSTKCQKYLYSLSLNPPFGETVSTSDFLDAINDIEETLGLTGQPRSVVFHTKEGRTHCHAVWSRIDITSLKAIKLTYPKRKLKALSLELFIKHGWEIPNGFLPGQEANPMNYTYQEYLEAKRGKNQSQIIKHQIKTAWTGSDNKQSFEAALERSGLFLARGNRRGFVAVDSEGNVYSLSRWVDANKKDLIAKLGEPEKLNEVDSVKAEIAERMTPKVKSYIVEVMRDVSENLKDFETQRTDMTNRHRLERENLSKKHDERWKSETQQRADRFSRGLRGIWDRLTGKHGQIADENKLEAERALARDQSEQNALKEQQSKHRGQLQHHIEHARKDYNSKLESLYARLADYNAMGLDIDQQIEIHGENQREREQHLRELYAHDHEQ